MLRLALLFLGFLTLVGLIWHIGPSRILAAAAGLGPLALLLILLPSLLMYALEALGWRITLGRHAASVTFWRLFAIRTAGERFTAQRMLRQYLTEYYVPAIRGQMPDDPPTA